MAYRIQIGEKFLAGLSVFQGNVPKNISVMADTVKQLGSGCHRLTIYASNMVTTPEVSSDLQVGQSDLVFLKDTTKGKLFVFL